jgi:heat shock protein HslJ
MKRFRLMAWCCAAILLLLAAAACAPADVNGVPDGTPGVMPDATPDAAAEAERRLAQALGVTPNQVRLVSAQQAEWQDSCLGLGQPNEVCAQVITPGWRLMFEVGGEQHEVRTDETGANVRLALEVADGELAGTSWQLLAFGNATETPVLAGTEVTLELRAGGEAVGSGGCNQYGGTYQAQNGMITFGEIVRTLIACEQAGVMEQEDRFFAALETATAYQQLGNELWITHADGVLRFEQTAGN